MPPYGWLLLAGALFFLEIFVPGLFLAGFGVAALIVALMSLLPLPAFVQWLAFIGLCIAAIPITRPLARLLTHREPRLANIDALIGQRGIVIEAIDARKNTGRVRVGTEEWRAESTEPIPEGREVIVLEVQGNRLIVSPDYLEAEEAIDVSVQGG